MGLLFTVSLPEIKAGERPRRRFMSAFEQKREVPNRAFQYMVVSPRVQLVALSHSTFEDS
jgi:splicing factor 3A subunit 2